MYRQSHRQSIRKGRGHQTAIRMSYHNIANLFISLHSFAHALMNGKLIIYQNIVADSSSQISANLSACANQTGFHCGHGHAKHHASHQQTAQENTAYNQHIKFIIYSLLLLHATPPAVFPSADIFASTHHKHQGLAPQICQ